MRSISHALVHCFGAFLFVLPISAPAQVRTAMAPARDPNSFRDDRILIIPKSGHEAALSNLHVAEGASIWFGAVLRGDVCSISIGRYSNVQDNTVIHVESEHGGLERRE